MHVDPGSVGGCLVVPCSDDDVVVFGVHEDAVQEAGGGRPAALVEVELLQHGGQEQEDLRPGQGLAQAVAPPWGHPGVLGSHEILYGIQNTLAKSLF